MFFNQCWRAVALLLIAAIALPLPAGANSEQSEQKAIIRAEKYYHADKRGSFEKYAARIRSDSVYQPLVDFRRALFQLRRKDPAALEAYIAETPSPYLREQARESLLVHYAKQEQWQAFARIAADSTAACAGEFLLLRSGERENATAAIRQQWRGDTRLNQPLCMMLYRRAYGKHGTAILTPDEVWRKLRSLAGARKMGASRRLLQHFHGFVSYKQVRSVVRRAERYIRSRHGLRTRANRELVMIAAMITARRKPRLAISRWEKFSQYFSEAENDHVWTVLATWSARWHRDNALALYARTSGEYADEQARAWRVRAALRAGDDETVFAAIQAMPADERGLSAWRYWQAITAGRLGKANALQLLTQLAQDEDDYYGLLAREAVGQPLVPPSASSPPGAAEAPAEVSGDFRLALALHRAGALSHARRVWRWAARADSTNDSERLAAAAAAAAAGWHLASIDAALQMEDTALAYRWRFPFPYKEDILAHAAQRGLDAAFVFGLIHQESRFMPKIVSSAHARGLMQVIPRTARRVARKHRYTRYTLARLTRVDTNLTIGTTYLSDLAKSLKAAPARVAAGYNAGPGRVARWYRASPSLLVTIENIPLTETRLYVKYLLANRLHYTARLGYPLPTMRDNMARSIRVAAGSE